VLDLKPENVLICIDNVEDIIQAELAQSASNTAASPPTKLIGVPPSKGRGGNQTPRSESIFITGSQPLPSPSSSFGSSPMIDKWSFTMTQIEKENGMSEPDRELAAGVSDVSLDATSANGRSQTSHAGGPSLLSQQAPADGPGSPSSLRMGEESNEMDQTELYERITVKIADLGNGK